MANMGVFQTSVSVPYTIINVKLTQWQQPYDQGLF